MTSLIPIERIENKIFLIRGQKVILDYDLADLYGVETFVLNQAVKRNKERFPLDFMFQINEKEWEILKSQIVMSSWGGRRTLPYAFTEQGVAMLSGVLKSKRAIMVNIIIMRAFVKLNRFLSSHADLFQKLKEIESRTGKNEQEIKIVFEIIRKLMTIEEKPKAKIGFVYDKEV